MGQSAFFQHTEGQNWKLGKVTDILGPNTYQVSGPNGGTYRRNRVHMRPTSITPKARDLSPVDPPRVLDVTPLALPEEAPQVCNPPTDPPVVNSKPCSVNENIAPTDSSGRSPGENRPRCEIKPPSLFKDYMTK